MEFLLGIFATGIVQLLKLLTKHFGIVIGRIIIFGSLFAVVFLLTYFTNTGSIDIEFWKTLTRTATSSIAVFEIIVKPILKLINKGENEPVS